MKEIEVEQFRFGGQAREAKNKAHRAGKQRRTNGQSWTEIANILDSKNPCVKT